ncbi:MAG: sel1 repeat family protein [Candidatus Thiodiazotropha sp.]
MPYKTTRTRFILIMAVLLLGLQLAGCSTTPDDESQPDPQAVMQEAHKAYAAEDYQKVFQLVYPLASSGYADAQYTLGYLYFHGLGVERSEAQAMNWIQRAAAQGHKKAQQALK